MNKTVFDEVSAQKKRNVLVLLTGPTGAGKTTLFEEVKKKRPNVLRVVTTTTRSMRPYEIDGQSYYFITKEKFEAMRANDEFFEWVEFREHLYGTQKKTVKDALAAGKDVFWLTELQGVQNSKEEIKKTIPYSVFVYLTAPSMEDLENRVLKQDGENGMHRWVTSPVKWELEQYADCDYLVTNEDGKLDEAVAQVLKIMDAKRMEIEK